MCWPRPLATLPVQDLQALLLHFYHIIFIIIIRLLYQMWFYLLLNYYYKRGLLLLLQIIIHFRLQNLQMPKFQRAQSLLLPSYILGPRASPVLLCWPCCHSLFKLFFKQPVSGASTFLSLHLAYSLKQGIQVWEAYHVNIHWLIQEHLSCGCNKHFACILA